MIALQPGVHDGPLAPVDGAAPLIQPPSPGVVDPHRQHELVVAELAGGVLGILQVAELGWDRWQDTWLLLAHGIALNGRAIVLCGSLQPEQLEPLPARPLVGDLLFCNLDCPDEVLAERLRARPAWRSWDEQRIAEHQRFAASLRSRIEPTLDTSTYSVEEVADRVARWVAGHLRH